MPEVPAVIRSMEQMQALLPRTAAEPLGVRLVSLDEDGLTLRMTITDAARQPVGLLHGGISMLLAETAASMHSCLGVDLSATMPVGVEINGSHLRSASEGEILARARLIRRSRTLAVHEVQIVHEQSDRVLCVARVTNFYAPRMFREE